MPSMSLTSNPFRSDLTSSSSPSSRPKPTSPLPSPLSQMYTHNPFFAEMNASDQDSDGARKELERQQLADEWEQYIESSRRGEYGGQSMPSMPMLLRELAKPYTDPEDPFRKRLGANGTGASGAPGSPETAMAIYEKEGYMPAIKGVHENERMLVIKRFGSHALTSRGAIDKIVDMTAVFFQCPIVVVSVVLEDKEILISTHGWDAAERHPGFELISVPLATSFCPHTSSRTSNQECFVLENTSEDWRFKNNPYCKDGGPIAFFASSNLQLPAVNPHSHDKSVPSHLPIGSLCLVDRIPHPRNSWTAEQGEILRGFGDMIAREVLLAFEQTRAELVAKQTAFLGDFLRNSLVNPSRPDLASVEGSPTSSATLQFQSAALSLKDLTNSDSVVILDLRAFKAPFAPMTDAERRRSSDHTYSADSSTTPTSSTPPTTVAHSDAQIDHPKRPQTPRGISNASLQSYEAHQPKWSDVNGGKTGSVGILGSAGTHDWEEAVKQPGLHAALSHALITFYSDAVAEFDIDSIPSPLSDALPSQTTASLSIPVFDHDGRPGLFFILCSFEKYFRFEPHDRNWVENVGAVSMSALLRQRILDADRAKLAFLSSISHELRLPLHSISSQLELIRTVASPAVVRSIKPLLDTADVSCESLRDILDDTLQFSKLSNASEKDLARPAPTMEVDLEDLIAQVIKSCWTSAKKQAGVNGDAAPKEVDLMLNYRLRHRFFRVDIGGLKRVLFNLIGNSIKFTATGSITVAVKPGVSSQDDETAGLRMVGIEVIDTGRGMSEEFIREHLFVPFRQEDSFSQGAGLGISIVETIVRRMKGQLSFTSELGVGTVASVALPLEVVDGRESAATAGRHSVRTISNELSRLLDPVSLSVDAVSHEEVLKSPAGSPELLDSWNGDTVRVLVVDDNHIARRILTTFLTAKKVPWVEAVDGYDAVEKFKSFRPHSVWLDVQMPVCGGEEASAMMREYEAANNLPRSRIIALSGLSGDLGNHSRLLEIGQLDHWIVKGGPSLKILGGELNNLSAQLAETGSAYF